MYLLAAGAMFNSVEPMVNKKEDYSFWTRYKGFATTEIMLYVIMIVGIVAGIIIFS